MSNNMMRWFWTVALSVGTAGTVYAQQGQDQGQMGSEQGSMGQDQGGSQQQEQQQGQMQDQQGRRVHLSSLNQQEVKDLQQQLQQQGLYHGAIDGIVGTETIAALGAFQQKQGFQVSGRIDQQTAQALGMQWGEIQPVRGGGGQKGAERAELRGQEKAVKLSNLSTDQSKQVQQKLKDSGYYNGPVDGQFHTEMTKGVKQVQQANNLPQTGKIDQKTAQALGIDYNQIQPVRGQEQPGEQGGGHEQQPPSGGHEQQPPSGGQQQQQPPSGGEQQQPPSGGSQGGGQQGGGGY
jgi:peptidoglycan hydrolase-like protein with peptidoglycan-binding domain